MSPESEKARRLIDDPGREFVASDILRLELLPKAHYHGRELEEQFYEEFFAAAVVVVTAPSLVEEAESLARNFGLSAADALHVAAAIQAGATQLITAEKPTKPLFRVTGIAVISLFS